MDCHATLAMTATPVRHCEEQRDAAIQLLTLTYKINLE